VEDAGPKVVHNVAGARFELVANGHTAHLEYQVAGDRIRLIHIEVPPAIQGHRYSEDLARAGLEYARGEHLRVVPICPVVRAYLTQHPEFLPLVDEHWIPILPR
jgi:predicted GNAT family acetyltransferase